MALVGQEIALLRHVPEISVQLVWRISAAFGRIVQGESPTYLSSW